MWCFGGIGMQFISLSLQLNNSNRLKYLAIGTTLYHIPPIHSTSDSQFCEVGQACPSLDRMNFESLEEGPLEWGRLFFSHLITSSCRDGQMFIPPLSFHWNVTDDSPGHWRKSGEFERIWQGEWKSPQNSLSMIYIKRSSLTFLAWVGVVEECR